MAMFLALMIIYACNKMVKSDKTKQRIRNYENDKKVLIITGDELELKNADFYREVPFNKDKYYFFFLITMIKDNENAQAQVNLLKACITYFLQLNVLSLRKENGEMEILINDNNFIFKNEMDSELFEILKSMSKNSILKKESFGRIEKNIADKIMEWNMKVYDYAQEIWNNKTSEERHKDIATAKGLERFLREYSYINEKNAEEVKIWEEYLTFSVLLGIANNVIE